MHWRYCPVWKDGRITELEAELKHSKYNYMGAMEDCKRFEAELAKERKEHAEDEAVYVACIAENAALVEAARAVAAGREIDQKSMMHGGGHSLSVLYQAIYKLSALLQSEGEI